MTLNLLHSRLEYWQTRLNLREWSITLEWATGKETEDEVLGCCNWNAEELKARIWITKRSREHESTLVHELLHILVQGHLSEVPRYSVPLERALNRMVAALLYTETLVG